MGLLTDSPGRDQPIQPRSKVGHSPALGRELLQRLLLAWGFSGERKFQRLPAGHRMDAAIGLQSSHYLIAGNKDLNGFVQSLSGAVLLSDRERAAAWAQASSEQTRPALSPVKVLDQSLGGYRILWENAQNLRARVGELVVLGQAIDEDDDDPRDWLMGVLRWLKCGAGDSLEAGVQLLSRQAEACVVRSLSAATSSKVIHRALLLKPLKLDGEGEPSLLVPSLVDEREESELLRLPDPYGFEEYAVCAPLKHMAMVENTGSYKQLLFSHAHEQVGDPMPQETGLRPNELDAIWSTV
jgi:cyclic-di-GMP-binding protein